MSRDFFDHSIYGRLHTGDGYLWEGEIVLLGFARHGWRDKLYINILVEEPGPPDAHVFNLLDPLMNNAARLPDLVVDALWNELSGNEMESSYWWAHPTHGLGEVNRNLNEPITKRDDLWRVLHPGSLFVRKDHGDKQLTAGIGFSCDFEEEHGLDVLTDGFRVLGTGYADDAEKYRRFAKR